MLNVGGLKTSEAKSFRTSLAFTRQGLLCLGLAFSISGCNQDATTLDDFFRGYSLSPSPYTLSGTAGNSALVVGNDALQITGTPNTPGSTGYDFQTLSVGEVGAGVTISVKNTSTVGIYIQSISIVDHTGSENPNFLITPNSDPTNNCPTGSNALASGASCSFVLSFQPQFVGSIEFPMAVYYGLNGSYYPFVSFASFIGTGVSRPTFAGLNTIDPATVSTTRVALNWAQASNANQYLVYKCLADPASLLNCLSGDPATAMSLDSTVNGVSSIGTVVNGLTPDTHYLFRVEALNTLTQSDGNAIIQHAKTDTLGHFDVIPDLVLVEGQTGLTVDLSNLCTDSEMNQPSSITLVSQSDPDGNCVIGPSANQIQCTPQFKVGHANWSSHLSIGCQLNDAPSAFTQTLTLNVSDVNRAPVMIPITPSTVLAGSDFVVHASAPDPDGDGVVFSCKYDSLVDGAVTSGAAECSGLINSDGSSASFNAITGRLNWTPPLSSAQHSYEFQLTAVDPYGRTGSSVFAVAIQPPPPSNLTSILSVASGTIASGSTTTVTLQGRDTRGNPLTYGGNSPIVISMSSGSPSGQLSALTDHGDGTYSVTFTGRSVGTATLTASILGDVIFTSLPTITVSPGPVSVAQSTVSVSSSTLSSGTTSTLTVIAKDALGNRITTGGMSVGFNLSGATGRSTGTISAVSDHGDGSYTATLTGVGSGSAATVGATLGGIAVSSSLPTVTVTPGAFSLANSTVSVTPAGSSVVSGSSVDLILSAKDAAGNQLTSGGQTGLSFFASGGTSTATLGSVMDRGDGTYMGSFTGVLAGTALTLVAKQGAASSSSSVSLTVVPGSYSGSTSLVSLSTSSITSGTSSTLATLQLKDAAGNATTSATPLSVSFYQVDGSSTVTLGGVSDQSNGSYTTNLTGVIAGGTSHLSARIGGVAISSTAPSFTVSPGVISVSQSTLTASDSTVLSGSAVSLTLVSKDAAGNFIFSGGRTVVFGTSGGTSTGTVSTTSDGGNGTYSASFTGLRAGTATTVTALIDSTPFLGTSPTIQVQVGAISLTQSSLTASSDELTAGNAATLTVVLKDANDNLILDASKASSLTAAMSAATAGLSQASFSSFAPVVGNDGTYQSTAVATAAGSSNTMRVTLAGSGVLSTQPSWRVSPGSVSATVSTVSASSSSVIDDGVSTATITVTLKDQYSNLVSGKALSLASSRAGLDTISAASGTSDSNGQVTFTVKSSTSGNSVFTATNSTDSLEMTPTATVSFIAGPVIASNSTIVNSGGSPTDNNSDTVIITVTLKDSTLNGVPGKSVTLNSNRSSSDTITPALATTDSLGRAVFTVNSSRAGTSIYTATNISDTPNITLSTTTSVTYQLAPLSPSLSTVVSDVNSLQADGVYQATVTVTALNLGSNPLSGQTVTLSSNQADTISPASATTNSSGVATFTISSTTVHTSTLTAAVNSTTLNAQPNVAFVAMVPDLSQSSLTLSSSSIFKNGTSVASLVVKNDHGVALTGGGLTVTFAASGGSGVSVGSFGPVIGTYASTFTASTKGTATTISATITGFGQVTQTRSLTVQNTAPVISAGLVSSATTYSFPLNSNSFLPLVQGTAYTLAAATDADGDSVSYTCTYSTPGLAVGDPNFAAAGTLCTNLPSLTSVNETVQVGTLSASGGSLSWTPTNTQRGTYQFVFTPTDGTTSGVASTLNVTVRENSTTSNLLAALDAWYATNATGFGSSVPSGVFGASSSATSWLNLLSGSGGQTMNACTWSGSGVAAAPYSLSFDGAIARLDLGSQVVNSSSKFAIETWVKPGLPTTSGAVIVGNGAMTANGFALRQSVSGLPGRSEFVVGQKNLKYQDVVLAQGPVGYWRLNESSGTVATELTGSGNNGTYSGSITLGATGALTQEAPNLAASFASGGTLTLPTSYGYAATGQFSVSRWLYFPSNSVQNYYPGFGTMSFGGPVGILMTPYGGFNNNGSAVGIGVNAFTSYGGTTYNVTAGQCVRYLSVPILNSWYHEAWIWDGINAQITRYYDGTVKDTITSTTNFACPGNGSVPFAAVLANYNSAGTGRAFTSSIQPMLMDDLAIFNYNLNPAQVLSQSNAGRTPSTYPGNVILADQPAGYWRLNETSGTTALDYSGNNQNGAFIGGATLNQTGALSGAGDSDTSPLFDGSTGYVQVPYSASLNPSKFSVELWVNVTGGAGTNRSPITSRDNLLGYIIYANTSNVWQFWIGNGSAWVITGNTPVSLNTWTHLSMTYDGTTLRAYVNGVLSQSTTGSLSLNTSRPLRIAAGVTESTPSLYFPGKVDEVAIYNYALSPTQVANHYNSGKGAGWWYCQSRSPLSNSFWNLLSAVHDTSTGVSQLYNNGQQECSVTPKLVDSSIVSTQPATNVWAGATPIGSNFWAGLMSTLKFFGTNDGTTQPLPSPSVAADFAAEANRYRATPVENIVTNGLVLNLDAANAQQGVGTFGPGCASTALSWWDLSGLLNNGLLTNFPTTCSTNGWQGLGTVASPYALRLNGTSNWVNIPGNSSLTLGSALSIVVWANTAVFGGTGHDRLISYYQDANNSYALSVPNDGGLRLALTVRKAGAQMTSNYHASPTAGTWQQFAGTWDGTTARVYRNGALGTTVTGNGWLPGATTTPTLCIGRSCNGTQYWNASIATVQIYNTALTQQQIKQNCLAQEKRFTTTPGTGSLCAAP